MSFNQSRLPNHLRQPPQFARSSSLALQRQTPHSSGFHRQPVQQNRVPPPHQSHHVGQPPQDLRLLRQVLPEQQPALQPQDWTQQPSPPGTRPSRPGVAVAQKRKSETFEPAPRVSKRRSSAAAVFSSDDLNEEFDGILAKFERDATRMQSKIRALQEENLGLKGLSNRVPELEGQVQQLTARKAVLKGELREARREAENMKFENTNLKNEVAQLQSDKEAAESNAEQALAEKATVESENERINREIHQLALYRPGENAHQETNPGLDHIADEGSTDLTPSPSNLPFSIAGEYMADGQAAQLTLEQLSSELQDKVSDFAEEMETVWLQKWKERKNIAEIAKAYQNAVSNQCLHKKCTKAGNSQWTVDDPRHYACGTCANQARLCFALRDGEIWLAPLPPDVAESNDPTELPHYVVRTSLKNTLHKDPNTWRFWKSSQTAA